MMNTFPSSHSPTLPNLLSGVIFLSQHAGLVRVAACLSVVSNGKQYEGLSGDLPCRKGNYISLVRKRSLSIVIYCCLSSVLLQIAMKHTLS